MTVPGALDGSLHKRTTLRLILCLVVLAPGLAAAQQPLDPVRLEGVPMAARSYAVDVSLVNVRFYAKDAQDPALDRRCIEGEVEKNTPGCSASACRSPCGRPSTSSGADPPAYFGGPTSSASAAA